MQKLNLVLILIKKVQDGVMIKSTWYWKIKLVKNDKLLRWFMEETTGKLC